MSLTVATILAALTGSASGGLTIALDALVGPVCASRLTTNPTAAVCCRPRSTSSTSSKEWPILVPLYTGRGSGLLR